MYPPSSSLSEDFKMGSRSNQPTAQATASAQLPPHLTFPAAPTMPPMASGVPMATTPAQPTTFAQPAAPNVFSQAAQNVGQAGSIYGQLGQFQAPDVQAPTLASAGSVGAGNLTNVNYDKYMNPYTQQVIERGEQDIARQRESALNALGAQATAANAYGGGRFGLAEGETYGQYGRMAGDLAAQQRQAAFQNAQQAAQSDISNQLQASLANQQARMSQASTQANLAQQAALVNQQAAFSGANVQSGAASGLSGIGGQQFGMGQSAQQAIAGQGQFQRGLQQDLLNRAMQSYGVTTGYPLSGTGNLANILAGQQIGETQQTSTPFNPVALLGLL